MSSGSDAGKYWVNVIFTSNHKIIPTNKLIRKFVVKETEVFIAKFYLKLWFESGVELISNYINWLITFIKIYVMD